MICVPPSKNGLLHDDSSIFVHCCLFIDFPGFSKKIFQEEENFLTVGKFSEGRKFSLAAYTRHCVHVPDVPSSSVTSGLR